MNPTVAAEAIEKTYESRNGGLAVLCGVTLAIEPGESVAIMGPSGSGKSTFLNIVGTLDEPTAGRISIDGTRPFELTPKELAAFRNKHIGFVFQDHHLLPQCTALENVLLPTLVGSRADAQDAAKQLLDRVGLIDRMDHFPGELSGGERQRVAIARSLINSPALILADEPTGNLDRNSANRVADLLFELHLAENTALLVVTHSKELALRFRKNLLMVDGTLQEP